MLALSQTSCEGSLFAAFAITPLMFQDPAVRSWNIRFG